MDDQRSPKKILRTQVYKSRKRGRPRIRWLDDVLEDLRRMDVRGYTEMAMGRRYWRKLELETSSDVGL